MIFVVFLDLFILCCFVYNTDEIKNEFWEELILILSYVSHLFEVLEAILMKINLSELILTSFNST
jgi:hypothetical protein